MPPQMRFPSQTCGISSRMCYIIHDICGMISLYSSVLLIMNNSVTTKTTGGCTFEKIIWPTHQKCGTSTNDTEQDSFHLDKMKLMKHEVSATSNSVRREETRGQSERQL